MEVGGGCWVELRVNRVPPNAAKPHGIDHSLCLLALDGTRLVCYDNAHPVASGRGPGRRRAGTSDHRHVRAVAKSYRDTDAETLLQDFWADLERVLKEEGGS